MRRVVHFVIPNWPGLSLGPRLGVEAVVMDAGRVVGVSREASEIGIRIGMTARSVRGISRMTKLQQRDLSQEAKVFSSIQRSLESVSPYFRYIEAGSGFLIWSAASRYFGTEERLVSALVSAILSAELPVGVSVTGQDIFCGVADGHFAASLAAGLRRIVPAGATREFLNAMPVSVLGGGDTVALLGELGIRTLSDLSSLELSDVSARFGLEGISLYHLASGGDYCPESVPQMQERIVITLELEQPIYEVEPVVFSAIPEIEPYISSLSGLGLVVSCVEITTRTSRSASTRSWTLFLGFDERSLAERIRWQLEGMIDFDSDRSDWDGVTGWSIEFVEQVPEHGAQLDMSGSAQVAPQETVRALARAEAVLGPDTLKIPTLTGARSLNQAVDFRPWQKVLEMPPSETGRRIPRRRSRQGSDTGGVLPSVEHEPPWPGSVPGPLPSAVYPRPASVELLDLDGLRVAITGRGELTTIPVRLEVSGLTLSVRGYLGPWLIEQRWWDENRSERYGRLLLLLEDGSAHLVFVKLGRWYIEASYD